MVRKKKAADEISESETENWFGHSYLNSFGFWGVGRGAPSTICGTLEIPEAKTFVLTLQPATSFSCFVLILNLGVLIQTFETPEEFTAKNYTAAAHTT